MRRLPSHTGRFFAACLGMLAAAVLAGCFAHPVARDLGRYVNQEVVAIAALEQGCLERYQAVSGPNYRGDETLYRALSEQILPVYDSFYHLARDIRPASDPVRELHGLYLNAAHFRLEGFKTLALAIESRDSALVRAANRRFSLAAEQGRRWRQAAVRLAGRYHVNLRFGNDPNKDNEAGK